MKCKITIVDDHPVVLRGLQTILAEYDDIVILDLCHSAEALFESLKKQVPDVLLLDINLPDTNGEEVAATISKAYPEIRVLALTNFDQIVYVKNMLRNGALGYLLKNSDPETLTTAISSVYNNVRFIDPLLREQLLQEAIVGENASASTPVLTKREQEILKLIADEFTSPEIASQLFLSQRTVESHRLNLLLKFGVKNTAGLVRKAVQLNILK